MSREESPQCFGVTLLTPHSAEARDNYYYNDHNNIRVVVTSQERKINLKVGPFEPILACSDIHCWKFSGHQLSSFSCLISKSIWNKSSRHELLKIFSISVSVRTAGVRAPVRWWIAGDGDDWGHLIGQSPCSG